MSFVKPITIEEIVIFMIRSDYNDSSKSLKVLVTFLMLYDATKSANINPLCKSIFFAICTTCMCILAKGWFIWRVDFCRYPVDFKQ